MKLYYGYYNSPIGAIEITTTEDEVTSIEFTDKVKNITAENKILKETISQLDEYFKGKRTEFKLKYKIEGTDFQKKYGWN